MKLSDVSVSPFVRPSIIALASCVPSLLPPSAPPSFTESYMVLLKAAGDGAAAAAPPPPPPPPAAARLLPKMELSQLPGWIRNWILFLFCYPSGPDPVSP